MTPQEYRKQLFKILELHVSISMGALRMVKIIIEKSPNYIYRDEILKICDKAIQEIETPVRID